MMYSERALRNMTKQVKGQLEFLEKNLINKRKRLNRTLEWLGNRIYSRLPGLKWTYRRQLAGVSKAKQDIRNHKEYILELQREGKINKF